MSKTDKGWVTPTERPPTAPLYIFDLDGTLANGDHRLTHILDKDPKDWDMFFSLCGYDKPIWHAVSLFQDLQSAGAEMWIWTGRSDMVKAETEAWLARYGLRPDRMVMRRKHDHTNDDLLKERWLNEMDHRDRTRLKGVFEDRNRVVAMWRRNCITCYHVAEGDF